MPARLRVRQACLPRVEGHEGSHLRRDRAKCPASASTAAMSSILTVAALGHDWT